MTFLDSAVSKFQSSRKPCSAKCNCQMVTAVVFVETFCCEFESVVTIFLEFDIITNCYLYFKQRFIYN